MKGEHLLGLTQHRAQEMETTSDIRGHKAEMRDQEECTECEENVLLMASTTAEERRK
jgi:hypothetical protein